MWPRHSLILYGEVMKVALYVTISALQDYLSVLFPFLIPHYKSKLRGISRKQQNFTFSISTDCVTSNQSEFKT